MKTKTLLAAFLLALLVAAVGAQTSTDKKPEPKPEPKSEQPKIDPKIDKLIEQLGDADFRKRDLAVDALKAEGVKVVPALRAALKHPDVEVRRRLVDLIPSIETAALLAPKRITLEMKDKTLHELAAELNKLTGYQFEFYPSNPNSRYTFEFKDVTFWEAVEQISKISGLEMQQGWGDDHVRLQQRGNGNGAPTYINGAFRLTPTSFQLYKNVDLTQIGHGNNARSESLTLSFAIQSEPKLPLLGIGQPRVTEAFDSEKNSILVPSDPNQYVDEMGIGRGGRFYPRYGNGNRMWYQQTQINLARVSEKATSVKVIRGALPVTLLSEQKAHVIAEKVLEAKGKKAVVGTTSLVVEEVTQVKNTNQLQIKITFNEDTGGNQNDYSWQNSIYQRLEVQDAKGNKFQVYGTNWENQTPTSMRMTLTYAPMNPNQKPDGDVKLVFQEWKMMHYEVKFEFKDLPLP